MKKVNLYLANSIRGPRHTDGVVGYVLEFVREGKEPVTTTNFRVVREVTRNVAELRILALALSKINENCDLTIYTDSTYLAAGLEKWLEQWKKNDWQTKEGKPVANKTEWQFLLKTLFRHQFSLVVGEKHSYSSWLDAELQHRKDALKK